MFIIWNKSSSLNEIIKWNCGLFIIFEDLATLSINISTLKLELLETWSLPIYKNIFSYKKSQKCGKATNKFSLKTAIKCKRLQQLRHVLSVAYDRNQSDRWNLNYINCTRNHPTTIDHFAELTQHRHHRVWLGPHHSVNLRGGLRKPLGHNLTWPKDPHHQRGCSLIYLLSAMIGTISHPDAWSTFASICAIVRYFLTPIVTFTRYLVQH